jgi:hypothetical protein
VLLEFGAEVGREADTIPAVGQREKTSWAIPLLGIYPKECDTGYSRRTCTPMFIEALFTIAKFWKQPRCPTTDE